ncbi:unnamed protein product [Polarella glacialis]|uniref:Uncharacterized protein n=1 Tax=Polarella glacialis TaxID=89957 RepID=A0A813FUD7_POLGL|nr:unnamed protein product [Polarella glacialis]|mmetsp:Transcript_64296/g.115650  ORF Transcript_64296/g.115650 Transcript_64296/m.115650 type:complete len:221 (+) Transcript_64296:127-789(+)
MSPLAPEDLVDLADLGVPAGPEDWLLLRPPFPEIEVIMWRIKLRGTDGNPKLDAEGNELYGEREWFTLDNRRLYCLQKAAVALHPKQVRCVVIVVKQEEGNSREFRKFRTQDCGRSIRIGHRDSRDLPRWSWRSEAGLPEEPLPVGTALPKQSRRRLDQPGWGMRMRRPGARGNCVDYEDDEEGGERSKWDVMANAALFVVVYFALRLVIGIGRHAMAAT